MFFEIWAEEFINKMEEEKKKRRAKEKERRKNRQKTQEANTRVAKETVKIVPLWVSFSIIKCIWLSFQHFVISFKYYAKFSNNRLLIKCLIEKTSGKRIRKRNDRCLSATHSWWGSAASFQHRWNNRFKATGAKRNRFDTSGQLWSTPTWWRYA